MFVGLKHGPVWLAEERLVHDRGHGMSMRGK